MKTTLPLLTLATALLAGCATPIAVKGIVADRAVERAKIKAPIGEECAPIMSWYHDMNAINGNTRTIGGAHNGLDMAASVGTSVVAAAPGVIVFHRFERGGHDVQMYHGADKFGNQVFSFYAHMSKFNLKVGSALERGQELGKSGDWGLGTGNEPAHLHFGASVHSKHDFQVFVDALRPSQIKSPNLFIYPMHVGNDSKPLVPERFPRFDPNTNYGDSNWANAKNFTGFTFPVSCAGAK